jgi:hypothetical protein
MKIISKPTQFLFLLLLLTQYFSLPKNATAQVIDSMYYGWVVYEIGDGDKRKCYIASAPHKSNSSYTGFRSPYLAVTRFYKNRNEEISLYSGYEYKINSDVYLLIGSNQKDLYTKGDVAWAKSDYDDKEIITLMLRNAFVKARSDSSFGNFAIDEYQMKGFTRAYARMKELCE